MRQETGDFLLRHEIFSYGRPTKKILGKLDIILSTVLYCIVLYCTALYCTLYRVGSPETILAVVRGNLRGEPGPGRAVPHPASQGILL